MIITMQTHGLHQVFDATGKPVKDFTWANTETGEVIVRLRYSNGSYVLDDGGPVTERRKLPAPLRVEEKQ